MGIVFDQPVRDITVRSGTQTNCAGIAKILADVEPAEHFEFVNAESRAWAGDSDGDLIDVCVAAVHRGVVQELTRIGQDELPAVRFVLRRIQVHPVDSTAFRNEAVGRMAVTEALRRLTQSP